MRPTLYIHIPFCGAKCAYCDFFSVPRRRLTEEFVDALCRELTVRCREWGGDFQTIYLGGGTPSSLSDAQLRRIIASIPAGEREEFTIEVNPEDVTETRAVEWLRMGIDRVSMGIQTFDDEILTLIGRRHTAQQAVAAYRALRKAGFSNISCDLIYGLPGQTLDGWRQSLERLLELRPEHISAYLLSYEPGTRLSAMLQAGRVNECQSELAEQMYSILTDAARREGYVHYEISNFALPGCEARHNSRYWDSTPYLGIGPGAHGFDGRLRYSNRRDIAAYIKGGGTDSREIEEETESEKFNDFIMTALRTARGFSFTDVEVWFGARYAALCRRAAAPHLASGVMVNHDGRLTIAESRWLISDSIIVDFFEVD